jgi:2-dehydro-3-deoxy-D-arabinonate dehydratase
MNLTRHETPNGPRWAADAFWLPESFSLDHLLDLPRTDLVGYVESVKTAQTAEGSLLAPIEAGQEVWASGVTYQRSREAREAESNQSSVYDRVYAAQRPELFFKAAGWRVVGPHQALRIRADSAWNVPEPELTLVINRLGEIIGYTAGNDMSSRSIEGDNPLYLPQAKIYNASCALGPAIRILDPDQMVSVPIDLAIERAGKMVFQGSTNTSKMNRAYKDLVDYLFRELSFPQGVFLLTGTGIVPPETFTLDHGDTVTVMVGDLMLVNNID